jgi:hypothetical protein
MGLAGGIFGGPLSFIVGMHMRIRASIAALSGALALSAFAVPAAHAVTSSPATIDKVVVNGGKPIVLGAGTKTFTATLTASDDSGINLAGVAFLHNSAGAELDPTDADPVCTAVSSTTSTCTVTFKSNAVSDIGDSSAAGTWYAYGVVVPKDANTTTGAGVVEKDKVATTKVQRLTNLSANAAPEPVKAGKTITVTGTLTRVSWATGKYSGLSGQSVKLQFRKKGTSTYTTLKTVTSGTGGALKAYTIAHSDGYYRFTYAGSVGTAASTATGDYVDVQ